MRGATPSGRLSLRRVASPAAGGRAHPTRATTAGRAWRCALSLRLLHDAGLQLHRAESIDLAVDVVVSDAVDQADVANLGADLDGRRAAFDPQVLDDGHGVT